MEWSEAGMLIWGRGCMYVHTLLYSIKFIVFTYMI